MTPPLDFTSYLSDRLGIGTDETIAVLGAWLKDYEPLHESRLESPSVASVARAREDRDPQRVSA